MEEVEGIVCSLERFATHDGPGIRTTVFMKGCPLSCKWCSSPHTRKKVPELLFSENKCHSYAACLDACPEDALTLTPDGLKVDRKACTGCGLCVEPCPNKALEISGTSMSVEDLFKEVEKDSNFYRRSNGGVTVSGGELTVQASFVTPFLKRCQEQYIHTAIETCAFTKWGELEAVIQHVDLIYIDIKSMDDADHVELTGVSNEWILENARKASERAALIIRIPVVPGHTDSDENIRATARFAAGLGDGFQRLELLPYHQLGTQRYEQLDMKYELIDVASPDDDHMARLKALAESEGVTVEIVG